jgi:hypothetical protein
METSNEIDSATIAICAGDPILARWSYVLDTSNDDSYPHISYGQLLLRGDGVVFHSGSKDFSPWQVASRARHGGPFNVANVEEFSRAWGSDYTIERIVEPADTDGR